ncbi:carcinoembryonic antigen-related cell adhesion molecule 1-like isoform X2 [Megalobrama amblycephala]|uniref:carcinoembryonic antigen-related cell adhesion molecule 1-like isoform X2 n=1 Tax=Megalobrama amblycephala TaxID=75352 RepID=UPI002013ED0B|nr:carcinoembryonic antigen-related cell adhesion molecule 1-like isoform X2 [Megalobrama amblycephala]
MHISKKLLARDIDGLKRVFHQFWIQSAVRNKTSMRNHFLLFGVFLVMEGVFGADEVTAISANVGDDVTLETGDTEVQRADELSWRIQGEIIARLDREAKMVSINTDDERFSGRLLLDKTTGSLTIKNINTADSGVYELRIISRSGVKTKTFSLTVHSEDVIVQVSVMEGDSVTLNINDTKQKDEELNWEVSKDENVYKSIKDERFKTGETGSLTITNINIKDSGLYRLEISSSTSIKYKAGFNVAVHGVFSDEKDGVKTVSEKTGTNVVLDTHVTKIQKDDISIEWTFGPQNISIAKLEGKGENKIYNYNDERFKNRLNLHIDSGDLTIKNANSEHSGLYQIKIINNTFTIQKRFSVTVSDSGLSSGAVAGIVGSVLMALLFAAALGVNYYQYTIISKLKKQSVSVTDQNQEQDETTPTVNNHHL